LQGRSPGNFPLPAWLNKKADIFALDLQGVNIPRAQEDYSWDLYKLSIAS